MIKLATIFSNGAVLQRHKEINIFGESDKAVTVSLDKESFLAESVNGKFCAVLPPHEAGVGYTLTASDGETTIKVENISIGEVFMAAGQSNMEMPLGVTDGAEDELEHCENSLISFYSIPPRYIKDRPINLFRFQYMDYSTPTWKVCDADSAKDFSAIGYYMAKKLQKTLGVPVGVIGCNWGGRIIEPFIPSYAFDEEDHLREYKEKYEASLSEKTQEEYDKIYEDFENYLEDRIKKFHDPLEVSYGNAEYASLFHHKEWYDTPWPQGPYSANRPGCVWDTMVEDIVPYSLKFIAWYQGEAAPGGYYYEKYGVLLKSWREAFKQDLPFYAMEIAPWGGDGTGKFPIEEDLHWALMREDQRKATLNYKNCYLITTMGLGDVINVHPVHKREISYRTARSVLHNTYNIGEKYENPYAVSAIFEENRVVVKFENDESLTSLGASAKNLYLSADGENFVEAKSKVENNELIAWNDTIKNPCEIRYCYSVYYNGQNLFNSVALPASPFRFIKK